MVKQRTQHFNLATKPLVLAIRALIAGGLAVSGGVQTARAELPIPTLSNSPADIASQGSATLSIDHNAMTINQTTDKASIDWQSFNIGSDSSVHFNQPSSTSVALNNIHQANASQILGSLTANGQVYLVNQNGFVFGQNSQVNVNSLVATTLGITEATFKNGLTNAFDTSGQAALQGSGAIYLQDSKGNNILDQNGNKIKIEIFIDQGAHIQTNASGGRVVIAAPVVDNAGTITTPEGQTILTAATDKVYFQEAGSNSGIRGLLVEVGTGGEVLNTGKILAQQGNASLMGFAVNQQGIVSATTSVNLNGSVSLVASEGIQDPTSTGGKLLPRSTVRAADIGDGLGTNATVTLGSGSLTSVELDANKTTTAIDAQAQSRSQIQISGHNVNVESNATVRAKSGDIAITAVDDPTNPTGKGDARVFVASDAVIDASGVKNVPVSIDQNIVQVQLMGNELRDSPLQRNGILYGQTVSVDVRDATLKYDTNGNLLSATIPIADITGAVERIARNIDQRSISGGIIDITSSGDVVTQSGSMIDFSGGSVAYQGGMVQTTQLMSGGQVYDIATADPNRHYDSIVGLVVANYPQWSYSDTWAIPGLTNNHYEAGYSQGAAGGTVNISAYEAALNGSLNGAIIAGTYQRTAAQLATGSTFALDLSNNNLYSVQDIVFSQNPIVANIAVDQPIPRKSPGSTDASALVLNADLFKQSGISNVSIKTNGAISLQNGAQMALPDFGSLNLAATHFAVEGSIVAPSGSVNLKPISVGGQLSPADIILGSSAQIDVAGLWANDLLDGQPGHNLGIIANNGGSVSLVAEQGNLDLQKGSLVDVSGGAYLNGQGQVSAGKGGRISLTAATDYSGGGPSSLILDGKLSGWAISQGGSLAISTNEVFIGPASAAPTHPGSGTTPLLLSPAFFQQNGFANYSLTANLYGLTVASDLNITPQQYNVQLDSNLASQATGSKLTSFSTEVLLSDSIRKPTNLTLSMSELLAQDTAQSLNIGKNTLIQTDAGGSVTLNSDTSVYVDGTINTPGGNIAININTPSSGDQGFFASQGIWLGANSQLLAAGVFQPALNTTGLQTGTVMAGGTVALTANRGYIVARRGSVIDVSGSSQNLDYQTSTGNVLSMPIASQGGTINLQAGEGMLMDGTLTAHSGGQGVAGGTLSVNMSPGLRNKPQIPISGGLFPDDINPDMPVSIVLSNIKSIIPANLAEGGAIDAQKFSGRAYFDALQLNQGGFGSLLFKTDVLGASGNYAGTIQFDGNVQLQASQQIVLDAPTLRTSNGQVTLNSDYAKLGSSQSRIDTDLGNGTFSTTLAPDARTGAGKFTVNAQGIDLIGGLSFNGFGNVKLNSQGDLRMMGIRIDPNTKDYLGELNLAGNLTLAASQIYPATLTNYTLAVSGDSNTTVTIKANGNTPAPVYSAGGTLTINAPNIIQQGVLEAPFGALALNAADNLTLAAGSVTSVSGNGLTVPFGVGSAGLNWLYPLDSTGSNNIVISSPPQKQIALTGKNVALNSGAKVNLSGGGDLYAYEFITGLGGSNDVLNPNATGYVQNYAVIPSLGNALTPYDPQLFPSSGLSVGESVYLGAGSVLAAGWYTLLPAHYALLPGAYLITPQTASALQNMLPGQTTTNLAGATVVAGRYGDPSAGTAQAIWQGFAVQAGNVARSYSQYTDYSANAFFASAAAGAITGSLPNDAGSLAISAQTGLTLGAQLSATPAGNGLGGEVDISATNLAIVVRRQDVTASTPGTVSLFAGDLNQLNAPSLLLGGLRNKTSAGQNITVTAQNLTIANNVDLKGSELLLAANNEILVKSGAIIETTGNKSIHAGVGLTVANQGNTNSDGALVRLSSFGQITVNRDQAVTGTLGSLVVESGAQLKSNNAMLLDSTDNTTFNGQIDMHGGSLALAASSISLGNAPANTSGLVLSDTQLVLDQLSLTSTSNINIYGGVTVNAGIINIDAAQIDGFNSAGSTVSGASLNANAISLTNSQATAGAVGTGNGTLTLNANEIQLGSGQYAITGFSKVNLNGTTDIKGLGHTVDPVTGLSSLVAAGTLSVAGDLNLTAGHFIGDAGATTSVDASGHNITIAASGTDNPAWTEGLGVSWTITGDAITSSGRFDLPSGILKMTALKGDIDLNSGSRLDVSGRAVSFDNINKYSPGGNVSLSANSGNIVVAEGASINVAGAIAGTRQASAAGSLAINAAKGALVINTAKGTTDWSNAVTALAGAQANSAFKQGQFQLAVNSLDTAAFSALNSNLTKAGFTGAFSLEQQNGDITIAKTDVVNAQQITLLADQGHVTVNGTLNASAANAGQISVYGRNGITLSGTGKILATASTAGAAGGQVTLDTVHRDDTGSGLLDLSQTGGLINVSGGANGAGGSVHLRTGRDDVLDTVNVTAINSKIQGADPLKTALEATRVYDGQSVITADTITAWQTDTSNFMGNAPVLANASGATIELLPGLEIRSSGDLTLQDTWDFMGWRYTDSQGNQTLPGFLTLRAGGNLNIDNTITDGFATTYLPGQSYIQFQNVLQPGQSWSYHLIAQGDVNLASDYQGLDPYGSGSTVTSQVMVRTGTGDININAGGSINFVADANNPTLAAAVYTMGTTAPYTLSQLLSGAVPGVPAQQPGESEAAYLNRLNPEQMNTLLRYGYFNETLVGLVFAVAEYPTQGGNINLQAGGDINGINTGQAISDWLVRSGDITANNRPTAWGINVSGDRTDPVNGIAAQDGHFFNQNVGSLAGGDVTVNAGGNINSLSVMLPTTGKPFGTLSATANNQWTQTGTIINGGGDLQVSAGNNIAGGEFYVGQGTANIAAGGSVTTDNNGLGALLELGNSTINVQARQDVMIASVLNPTVLAQTNLLPYGAGGDSQFFTYSDSSGIDLLAIAGNTLLQNNVNGIRNEKNADTSTSGFEYAVYPGSLFATALSGDLRIENSMTLFPSAQGKLMLLAGQNINTDSNAGQLINFSMSDADIAFLPTVNNPAQGLNGSLSDGIILAQERLNPASPIPSLIHAATPVHTGDSSVPTLIAKLGDIAFNANSAVTFYLPQAAYISAGRDINNLSLSGQNLLPSDITQIKAGRNINYDTSIDNNGIVQANSNEILLGGPGQLQIQAGGSINLGGSAGINTIGNTINSALSSSTGASVNLLAGISDTVDYSGFIAKYFTIGSQYLNNLQILDGQGNVISLTPQQKLTALQQMPDSQKQTALLAALANEIKLSAALAAAAPESQRKALYQEGFAAIATLFPGSHYQGDLSLVFSQIKTLAGGGINIAVPGGAVNVGLAGTVGGIAKTADELGIVVQESGDINAVTQGDFNVNQSRVFTMGGGDIAIWSSQGNIDAGKGAKSAISAPAPIVSIDSNGNIVTTFPPIVSGSGIQTINPQDSSLKQGNVYLAAPAGVIDAGEAGISGGKVVIAATAVVGASNITASAGSIGVPVAVSVPAIPSVASSAAASASKQASTGNDDDSNGNNSPNGKKKSAVSLLSADVVGYGKCTVADVREAKSGCGG